MRAIGRRDGAIWARHRRGSSGGRDGALYDPTGNSWTMISASPLSKRFGCAYAWSSTTQEFIVWGGRNNLGGGYASDGAAFTPSKGTWRTIAASPLAARGFVPGLWL